MTTHLFRRSLFATLSSVLLALCCGGCATDHLGSADGPAALGKLMVQRLEWMDQVARVKQAKNLPITDPKREAELLSAMVKQGEAQGVPARAVEGFFTGQMKAAKLRQEEWIKAHPQGQPSRGALPELATAVRPALDRISAQMIEGLAEARKASDSAAIKNEALQDLTKAHYSKPVTEAAMRGLETGLAK